MRVTLTAIRETLFRRRHEPASIVGSLAASRVGRLFPLLCCAHELVSIGWLPVRSLPHMAACAEATQPTNPVELGSLQSNSAPIHTAAPKAASIPGRAILRVTYLRQEPYAVVPLVRIRAGATSLAAEFTVLLRPARLRPRKRNSNRERTISAAFPESWDEVHERLVYRHGQGQLL